jgi:uncharacterized protein YdaU (DUF1376 family)
MNYYEHHIGDYDADTAHLSWVEDMAYTRLLRLYYRKERAIPADIGEACRLVRATAKDQRASVEAVLREFFTLHEDGWHQKRCDADIDVYQKRVEHNRTVGKLGGRPKKLETQKKPSGFSAGSKTEPKQNPPQTPDPIHQENPQTPKGAVHGFPPGFDRFWEVYPKKVGKDAAGKAFAKRKFNADSLRAVLQAIEAQKASPSWRKDGGQYIPNPATWLNEGRWQDEVSEVGGQSDIDAMFRRGSA